MTKTRCRHWCADRSGSAVSGDVEPPAQPSVSKAAKPAQLKVSTLFIFPMLTIGGSLQTVG